MRHISRFARGLPWVAILLLAAGCGHSEPFAGATQPPLDGPLVAATPLRLTYDDGMDHVATFSPDGATLLYSAQPLLTHDRDRCIGLMPPGGGTRQAICRFDAVGSDTTDAFEHAALSSDGGLLYGAFTSRIGAILVDRGALRLGTVAAPWPGRALLITPTTVAGLSFDHVGTIRWLSSGTFFVVVTDQTLIGNPSASGKFDTLTIGVGMLRGDLTESGAVFTAIAGADSANGFDFSAAKDSIYFTRQDDATLYAMPIGGGARRSVYTEAPQSVRRIVRDPVRVGARVAVIGQNFPARVNDRLVWTTGLEPASAITLVRPSDGTATILTSIGSTPPPSGQGAVAAFGALAASPDGCRLIVEHRMLKSPTFTTDLYAYCLGVSGQCSCS